MIRKEIRRIYLAFYTPISPFNFFINGLLLFFFGLWLIVPFWDALNTSPIFSVMDATLPEWLWGAIIMATGMIKLWAARTVHVRWMRASAISGFILWSIMAGSFWVSSWQSPGCLIFTFFVLQSAWHYFNLSVMGIDE